MSEKPDMGSSISPWIHIQNYHSHNHVCRLTDVWRTYIARADKASFYSAMGMLSKLHVYMYMCIIYSNYTEYNDHHVYMEIHVLSTLAYENKKEKKGNPPNHDMSITPAGCTKLNFELSIFML